MSIRRSHFDPSREDSAFRLRSSDGWIIALLIVLAFGIQVFFVSRWPAVSRDGTAFLWMAESFERSDFHFFFSQAQHPLFPLFIVAVKRVLGKMVLSGQVVGIISVALLVIPVYLFGLTLFDRFVAVAASLMLSLHPALSEAAMDVLTEPLYILLLLSALCVGYLAVKRAQLALFITTGLFAGLAYLTRPEGIVALLWVGLYAIFSGLFSLRLLPKKVLAIGCLCLAFLSVAGSYFIFLRAAEGRWRLTRKKDLVAAVKKLVERSAPIGEVQRKPLSGRSKTNVEPARSLPPGQPEKGKLGEFLHTLLKKSADAFSVPLLFLVLLGLVLRGKSRRSRDEYYLILFAIPYLAAWVFVFFQAGYLSHRHILPVAILWIPFAPVGLRVVSGFLRRLFISRGKREAFSAGFSRRNGWLDGVLLLLVIVGLLMLSFGRKTEKRLALRLAGERIAEDWRSRGLSGEPVVVAPLLPQVILYAGGKYGSKYGEFCFYTGKGFVRGVLLLEADYVALRSDKVVSVFPDLSRLSATELFELLGAPIPLARSGGQKAIWIFRVIKGEKKSTS